MQRRHTTIVGIAFAFASIGLVACGSSGTKVVQTNDGKVTVDRDGKSVTIQGEHGAATFGGTKVPAGFPSDVPLPKGLRIKTAAGGTDGGKKFFTIAYDLGSKSPATVAHGFQGQLEDAGFTVANHASFGSGTTAVDNLSATGNGYRVAATGAGSGHLYTVVVTTA